jgi:hypothetical protein
MSLAQFYVLSAPAFLGMLAISFGLFELHRVRRVKAEAATAKAMELSATPAATSGSGVSEGFMDFTAPTANDMPPFKGKRSFEAQDAVTLQNQLEEAQHYLDRAMRVLTQSESAQEKR